MRFSIGQRRIALMILGVSLVATLLFTTWAMVRVSAWIVGHDSVEDEMIKHHHRLEVALAEAFYLFSFGGLLLLVEAICGMFFLWWLWRLLYRAEKEGF